MPTHPLWRPYDPDAGRRRQAERVGKRQLGVPGVVGYDPSWPTAYATVRDRVFDVLGDRVVAIDHVGSTSVPGLAAKPVVDLDLVVADAAAEPAYVPELVAAGFVLTARDPDWEQHRCLTSADPNANLHVWSVGAVEPRRHALFRRWLVEHPAERDAYAALKLALTATGFGADYNGAKSGFLYDVHERAFAADPAHPHTPQPRRGPGVQAVH